MTTNHTNASKMVDTRAKMVDSRVNMVATASQTVATTRLPRYRRAATEVNCVLTSRDIHILQTVHSFRLLTSELIQMLAGGSAQGILRRLQKLYHAGYLDRLRPQWREDGGSAKMVYGLTNQGVRVLQKEGLLERTTRTDWNSQNRGLHDFSIKHTLLVSRIRALLTAAATPSSGVELAFWREGRELQDAIEVQLPDRYARVPVAPDGAFGLRGAKGRAFYFVEADRGTMTIKRFTRKLLGYAEYFRQRRHVAKYRIDQFRVLTVTSSAKRARNLVEAAASADALRRLRRMFLFTSEEKLSLAHPASVLETIWSVPGESAKISLLGAPAKIQKEGG
jgi:hypothetical protein